MNIRELLGWTRIVVLSVLIAVTAGSYVSIHYFFIPGLQGLDAEIMTANDNINAARKQITDLKEEYSQLREQLIAYRLLEESGFFNSQSRVLARDFLDYLTKKNRLIKSRYNISPAEIIYPINGRESNHVILSSNINLDIEAVDDVDIMSFLSMAQKIFPCSVFISNFDMSRMSDVTPQSIQALKDPNTTAFTRAAIVLQWRSMAPVNQMNNSGAFTNAP